MKFSNAFTFILIFLYSSMSAQTIELTDNFEPTSEGLEWFGDIANVDDEFSNPFPEGINTSETVLEYIDYGAYYSFFRFDAPLNFDLRENSTFTLKIYVPSESITGDQPNQIAFKLQNNNLIQPWTTQTEIIKTIELDQWQELSFDFSTDEYINLSGSSPAPTDRFDLNRVLIQINGEANSDLVNAYIDDFAYDGLLDPEVNPSNSIYNTIVWSDEFDSDEVDLEKWFHQTLLPNGWSWFNNEQQHYTDREENSYVENGFLHIVAKDETYFDQGVTKDYTSARLNSKFAFTYGRVVARAKMPFGAGTWPAIWMLGKNITENGGYWADEFGTTGWPECGEIDIMEHWGNNQNVISAALHTPSSYGATENYGTIVDEDVSEAFHNYEMEWTPDAIKFYIDGTNYYTYDPAVKNADTWPFTEDQYLLLNIAIESNVSALFEESDMVLDYVRVYQQGSPTSTEDVAKMDLKLYPNPASDLVIIQSSAPDQSGIIEVFSLTGVKVLSQKATGTQTVISLNQLAAGSYVAMYRNQDSVESVPFVKID
jgi:beta-glucanase (GH16 family)